MPPFRRLLVANRGEIAVRVIRACRELGIESVAVYSEADAGALHVKLADEAHPCGPAPARKSYLDGARLVAIAREAGAEAVHPGYGFLSENGDFADACEKAGLRFVGPPGAVIRAMGSKLEARRALEAAGVPVVPGSGALADADATLRAARALGFPLLLKASAGGGGRGMRLVEREEQLAGLLPRARSEAAEGFGDGTLYLEKRIEGARHVEVQLLADAAGGAVHLFERGCSIQRRHQKLLEEAPAPGVDAALRDELGRAALRCARAVGYVGAGTCEFLLAPDGRFYFLEMNTRIQVEHPVTEAVTGLDLVKAQIRIAAGEPLGLAQEEVVLRGHALEARIYAEDPERKFLPSPGGIAAWRAPGGPGIRVDEGIAAGDEVTVHYDALLAKLVAWGADRAEATARLRRAVDEARLEGIRSTLPFHRYALRHPRFAAGDYDTGFVDEVWEAR